MSAFWLRRPSHFNPPPAAERAVCRPGVEQLEERRLPASSILAVGADGGGGPRVAVYNGALQAIGSFFAFPPNFAGGVRVAVADVNGDGTPDIIVGAAHGPPIVEIVDGTKLNQVQSNDQIASSALLGIFFAFPPTFQGGVNVAAADVNGDGKADVVVGAGPGGGPQVIVVNGANVGQAQADGQIAPSALLGSFYAFTPAFSGGVSVAAGDLTGDGKADVVVAPASNGAALIRVIDGTQLGQVLSDGLISPAAVPRTVFGYDPTIRGGVNVAVADVTGDGRPDIVAAPANPGNGNIRAFNGVNGQIVSSFAARGPGFRGGLEVAASDFLGRGRAQVFTANDPGQLPAIVTFDGLTGAALGDLIPFGPLFRGGFSIAALTF